jgi:hypothetical protein
MGNPTHLSIIDGQNMCGIPLKKHLFSHVLYCYKWNYLFLLLLVNTVHVYEVMATSCVAVNRLMWGPELDTSVQ